MRSAHPTSHQIYMRDASYFPIGASYSSILDTTTIPKRAPSHGRIGSIYRWLVAQFHQIRRASRNAFARGPTETDFCAPPDTSGRATRMGALPSLGRPALGALRRGGVCQFPRCTLIGCTHRFSRNRYAALRLSRSRRLWRATRPIYAPMRCIRIHFLGGSAYFVGGPFGFAHRVPGRIEIAQ